MCLWKNNLEIAFNVFIIVYSITFLMVITDKTCLYVQMTTKSFPTPTYKRLDLLMEKVLPESVRDYCFFSQDKEPFVDERGKTRHVKQFYKILRTSSVFNPYEFFKTNASYYELIVSKIGDQPVRQPVKLFLDLEIEGPMELDEMPDRMWSFIDWVIKILNGYLKECEEIELSEYYSRNEVKVWDSCRKGKLSFHVIFNGIFYFESIFGLKHFVTHLRDRIERPQNEEEEEMFEKWKWSKTSGSGEQKTIFDLAVYSKTQSFRLPWQSKIGKPDHILRPLREQDGQELKKSFITNLTSYEEEALLPFPIDKLPPIKKTKPSKRSVDGMGTEIKTKGLTLFKKKKLFGFDELLQLNYPRWKQFLFLIPNGEDDDGNGVQPFQVFKNVIEEIAYCGGTIADAEQWYHLYEDNPNDQTMANFDNIERADRGYYSFFFEESIKQCCPQFLDHIAFKRIEDFYRVRVMDDPDIEYIEENKETKFVSDLNSPFERDRKNIFHPAKTLIIHAGMGRG